MKRSVLPGFPSFYLVVSASLSAFSFISRFRIDRQGFLVENKLQQLLAPLQASEQRMIRLDAIFKVTVRNIMSAHTAGAWY